MMIYPDWPAPANVRAAVTTRAGGVSRTPYASFNLAAHVSDKPADVRHNRQQLRQDLALPGEPLWLTQVHGNRVVDVAEAEQGVSADAGFSYRPGAVCAVLTADCLPVLFCDETGTRVAAAHAGWRGLAAGVLEASVAAMDTAPGRVMAWLGPAIGPGAFEVGPEVREAFVSRHAAAAAAFEQQAAERWLADLYQLARIRLQSLGVEAVFGGGLCTFSDPQRFYSYRRDRVTGRMAALVWLA